MYQTIYASIHPVYLSICLSLHLCIYVTVHYICLSDWNLSIHLGLAAIVHLSIPLTLSPSRSLHISLSLSLTCPSQWNAGPSCQTALHDCTPFLHAEVFISPHGDFQLVMGIAQVRWMVEWKIPIQKMDDRPISGIPHIQKKGTYFFLFAGRPWPIPKVCVCVCVGVCVCDMTTTVLQQQSRSRIIRE